MQDKITELTEEAIGCHLDNHRGHYLSRDVIQLAEEYGFIIGPMEQWALHTYEKQSHENSYPHETLQELCDEAIAWLNSGQTGCIYCAGTGKVYEPGKNVSPQTRTVICHKCSGTGRGDRIKFQNFPPHIPAGTTWDWNDGDFGLWRNDDME